MSSPEEMRVRTKSFALRMIGLCRSLPKTDEGRIFGRQVLRSGTGVAANYRAACRARSRAEFAAKIGVFAGLLREANELLAIFSASRRTARQPIVKSPNHQITNVPLPLQAF